MGKNLNDANIICIHLKKLARRFKHLNKVNWSQERVAKVADVLAMHGDNVVLRK